MVDPKGGHGIVRRIFTNLGLLTSGKAAAGLISLVYMMIAARALGPSDYGMLILMHGYAMAVGGIIEFPGWHAIVRYGAHALERRDLDRLLRLLRFAGSIEAVGGVASIIVAATLAPLIGPRLGWSAEAQAFALPYSLAVLASIRATPAGLLQLMGRFDLLGFHNVVAPLIRLFGAIAAALAGFGLTGFLVAWLIAALAEWLVMWVLGLMVARAALEGRPLLGSTAGTLAENRGIWRFMIAANADITFGELAGRILPLGIGWILGPAAAGLYGIAQRATVIIQQPAQILGQAAYAEFARALAIHGSGRVVHRALAKTVLIATAIALPFALTMIFAGGPIAMLMGGTKYIGAASLIGWLGIARMIALSAPPISSALVAFGRPGWSVSAKLATSLLCLPLLVPLVWQFGLLGAGIQAVVQAALTGLTLALLLRWTENHSDGRNLAPAL
jgi:O-antigen/teichoic acid export membrane protein